MKNGKKLDKKKVGKWLIPQLLGSFILCVPLLFLTACSVDTNKNTQVSGTTTEKGSENEKNSVKNSDKEKEVEEDSVSDKSTLKEPVKITNYGGNSVNGRYQGGNVCIGDGKIYYSYSTDLVDGLNLLCSANLDGSDKTELLSDPDESMNNLNYYKGSIYYSKDYMDLDADVYGVEIHCYNADGDAKIANFERGFISCLQIFNDDLFYIVHFGMEETQTGVIELNSGKETIFGTTKMVGMVEEAIDTDGNYVYFYLSKNGRELYRIPWSDIHRNGVELEKIEMKISVLGNSMIFADNGFYVCTYTKEDPSIPPDFIHYDYKDLQLHGSVADWPATVILEGVENDDFHDDESLIRNLIYYGGHYVLDDCMLSFYPWLFFHSDSLDYRLSTKILTPLAGGIEYAGKSLCEYEGEVYAIFDNRDSENVTVYRIGAEGLQE